jgi:hypothetical protein
MLVLHVTLRGFLCMAILNLSRSLSSVKSKPLFVLCFNYIIIDRITIYTIDRRMCNGVLYPSGQRAAKLQNLLADI